MTEKSYPRLENGVVIHEPPPAAKQDEKPAKQEEKPASSRKGTAGKE